MEQVKVFVGGLIRHGITTVGGALVANGSISGSDLEMLAGAGAVIVGVLLSFIEKKLRKA